MTLHAPQFIILGLMILSTGMHLAKHGDPKTGTWNFGHALISDAITISLLYWGGDSSTKPERNTETIPEEKMNLTIQLTDEQADKLAADLLSKQASKPEPLPEIPSETLPEPPEGFHKAMMGPIKGANANATNLDISLLQSAGWNTDIGWGGALEGRYYALRIGSEIAKLNGLEPAKPARREFVLRDDFLAGMAIIDEGDELLSDNETITVREVLPGDPTPEQVEELVNAARKVAEYWASGNFSRFPEICNPLYAALAPFRKD